MLPVADGGGKIGGHGHPAGVRPGHGLLGAGPDGLHRRLGVHGQHAAAPALVHRHGDDAGDQIAGEIAQGRVPGQEGHRHAAVPGGVGVDEELAGGHLVQGYLVTLGGHGVGQGVAAAGCPGVVAGKEHRAELSDVQPRHHGEGVAGPAPEEPGLPGQPAPVQVAGGVVGVLHHDLLRPGGHGALTGGGHFGGHLGGEGAVVVHGGPLGLRPVGDAAGALNVGAEIDSHARPSLLRTMSSTWWSCSTVLTPSISSGVQVGQAPTFPPLDRM